MTEERPPVTSSIVAWIVEDAATGDELPRGTWTVGQPAMTLWCPPPDTSQISPKTSKYHMTRGWNHLIPDSYHLISRKYHMIHGRNRLIPHKYHMINDRNHLISYKYCLIPEFDSWEKVLEEYSRSSFCPHIIFFERIDLVSEAGTEA
uniref:Uncharacterized protein n=1 Tax=Oryza punctata TaxID=4537 RepID=A0A0E0MGT6_ORYPU